MYSNTTSSTGPSTDHRSGFFFTQADKSIEAAITGAYQSELRSVMRKITVTPRSQPSASQRTTFGALPVATRSSQMRKASIWLTIASTNTSSGTATTATRNFDSTVMPSDTGSDFQKRMLRSLRSAYRQSSA